MITFQSIDVTLPESLNSIVIHWVDQVIRSHHKKTGEVFFLFCSDNYLLEINQRFLNHDTLTDIITFNNSEDSNVISGEIFISLDRVKENAMKTYQTIDNELSRVLIHGILHLIGFDDKSDVDKQNMRLQENISLAMLV